MEQRDDEAEGIAAQGVTVVYANGKVALRDASFALPTGSICGLVGVNGGGKSTLFKAIMGFVPLAAGQVRVGGRSPREAQRRNMIAYVPQAEDVDWNFPVSVWDAAMMGRYGYMNVLRIPKADDREIVAEALARVQMTDYAARQIGELSGGQRKRAFVARALAQRGRFMLLDEPLAGVDTTTQAAILALLRELRAEGHTILISTHDLASVPQFCDELLFVNGTVIAAGPVATTFTPENLDRTFGGVVYAAQAATALRATP